MIPFQFPLRILSKWLVILFLVGCANTQPNDATFSTIHSFKLTNLTNDYTLLVKNTKVGSATITINTGDYKQELGGKVISIQQSVSINQQNGDSTTYISNRSDGYFINIEGNSASEQVIPLPINHGDTMRGPFSCLTNEHVTLIIQAFHNQFTNQNGHEFYDVIEAATEDGTIRMFFNETHFIIQKEDYRYVPTVISLNQP